jgi:hypothetical protein
MGKRRETLESAMLVAIAWLCATEVEEHSLAERARIARNTLRDALNEAGTDESGNVSQGLIADALSEKP